MPKIPTFTSEARPTAQAASVVSNIQIPLNETVAGALRPLGKAAEDYYIKEKEIETKVQAGELNADATVEVFNAASEAELKNTPQEGIDYFNQKFQSIQNKYKAKAPNKNAGNLFNITFSQNKSVYVNNILKKTRDNLVTTRVTQVDQKVKSKIAAAISSGSKFEFDILAKSVEEDYQGLVDDGIIGTKDLKLYREKLPSLIETQMVKKIAIDNAFGALTLLDDNKNYPNIKGDARQDLRKELRQIATFQGKAVEFATNKRLLESKKKVAAALKGAEADKFFGINPDEINQYYTGNEEYDNQINNLNNKIINNEISLDNNYLTNDKIINKILNNEIKNSYQKFKLAGETEAKSITERIGDGSVNLDDDNFFNNIFESQQNPELNKTNKEFFGFIDKVVPLIEGSPSSKYFDNNYNNRLSSFRQDMYGRFVEGLKQNIPVAKLLDSLSDNYIAKDILDYAPTKSNVRDALLSFAQEQEPVLTEGKTKRLDGETPSEYLERIQNKQKINIDDASSSLDVNKDVQQVGFVGDLILGKDRFLIANWNKHYQTDNTTKNSLKARERLSRDYTVPDEAVSAIENAATNFAGDGGFSKEYLIDALTKIGQIETQYETKIQRGNNPEIENFYARSYWQIEVDTAKDLLENSAPIFGQNFESTFSDYAKDGKTARESLLNLDDKDLVNLLEKDDTLAANIAASLIVTRFDTEIA